MSNRIGKRVRRTMNWHNDQVKIGVGQHVTQELQKQDYDKALKDGVICIAAETMIWRMFKFKS